MSVRLKMCVMWATVLLVALPWSRGVSVDTSQACGDLELLGFFSGVSVRCVTYPEVPYDEHYIEVLARDMIDYLPMTPDAAAEGAVAVRVEAAAPAHPDSIMIQEPSAYRPNGMVGMALDGIPIYSALSAVGQDAVSVAVSAGQLDHCGGMWGATDDGDRYHYRVMPACILIARPRTPARDASIPDDEYRNLTRHQDMTGHVMDRRRYVDSPRDLLHAFDSFPGRHLLGWALDGHAIYSPAATSGSEHEDLDNCNGKYMYVGEDGEGLAEDWSLSAPAPPEPGSSAATATVAADYAYFASATFPYVVGCDGPGVYERGVDVDSGVSMEEVARAFAGVAYTSCPGGMYPDPKAPEGCVQCAAGKYSTSATPHGWEVCNMDCPRGFYCPAGSVKPLRCTAGRYGSVLRATDAECSGECDEGYYCPAASTSSRPYPCGNTTYICPAGAGRPRAVDDGFYTLPESPTRLTTRVRQAACKPGSYCVPTSGVQTPCPAGRYGGARFYVNDQGTQPTENEGREVLTRVPGWTHSNCTEICPMGHYCPVGSVHPRTCPAGRYGVTQGLTDSKCSGPCAEGHYCPTASQHRTQLKCPAGRYGPVTGLTSEHCSELCEMASVDTPSVRLSVDATPACELSSICEEGYYCPAGSATAHERECGGAHVYCPPESALPTAVVAGYYSVGRKSKPGMPGAMLQDPQDALTRTSQTQCEPGYYCHEGVKYPCLHGRYNSEIGAVDMFPGYEACPPCHEGHFCDAASPLQTQHLCGSPSVYCPIGTHTPVEVPAGFYSVGSELTTGGYIVACEPGFFCVGGIKRPCAAGTYSLNGSPSAECDGLCTPGFWCEEGSFDPEEHFCPGGRYGHAGMTTEDCRGSCLKGYYCPAGSVTPWQNECGDEYKYCPHGSPAPVDVTTGYYSTGGNATTRYAQEACGQYDTPPAGKNRLHHLCPTTVAP